LSDTASKKVAKKAGLRYEIPGGPGILRKKVGKGFRYVYSNERPVRHAPTLKRIRELVIPPGWTSVWISPRENAHIQAIGRDAQGRKQYRYHPAFRQIKDEIKFHKLLSFGRSLPKIRAALKRHLKLPGLPRLKVLATVVSLLETTSVRVGNDEYAKQNGSFGLTTLRNRHVKVHGSQLLFQFRGKSGVEHTVAITNQRLARVVRSCQSIPGHELFSYMDEEGAAHSVDSGDVNEYLRELAGADITAKDFRTWNGSCLAIASFSERLRMAPANITVKSVVEAIKEVARCLGNRPATCKKFYVHPAVVAAYENGELARYLARLSRPNGRLPVRYEEQILLAVLKETGAPKR
jgi:DNA topoisomerase-1